MKIIKCTKFLMIMDWTENVNVCAGKSTLVLFLIRQLVSALLALAASKVPAPSQRCLKSLKQLGDVSSNI
jgi:hypothetical protein